MLTSCCGLISKLCSDDLPEIVVKSLKLFLPLVMLPALLLSQPEQEHKRILLVFTHVTIIDATGSPARPDMTVVITDDRITTLGQTGTVTTPKEAQVVDATGL